MGATAVLDALGHPTRRSILEELAAGPLPVGVLAERLPISRPATSQHLRVLEAAELVAATTIGTRHEYRIDPTGLHLLRDYLARFWGEALDRFAELAESEAARLPAGAHDRDDETEENP